MINLILAMLSVVEPAVEIESAWDDSSCFPGLITVDVFGPFNDALVREVDEAVGKIKKSGQPLIPVIINSNGGSVYSLLAIIDILKNANKPVLTVVNGKAFSAAAVLFSFGSPEWRFMSPNSVLMVHQVSSEAFGKAEDVAVDSAETTRLNKLLMEMMSENIGKPVNFFDEELRKRGNIDWFFTPQQAKDIGFAKHLHIPYIKVKVSVDVRVM